MHHASLAVHSKTKLVNLCVHIIITNNYQGFHNSVFGQTTSKHQRFSLVMPGTNQNIAFHAKPTARNSTVLISAFKIHLSSSFF